jgi:hypothetical protein
MTVSNPFVWHGNKEDINAQPVFLVDPGAIDSDSLLALGNVGGFMTQAAAEFNRPTGTTAYIALDAVANLATGTASALIFSNLARIYGGTGYVVKARMMTDQPTNTARFRLHLYDTLPTAILDNAFHTMLWTNRDMRLGSIDFNAMASESSGSTATFSILTPGVGNLPLAFTCITGSKALYGLLETLDAFTPAHNQGLYIQLSADVN